jgi:hypothetical protein
VDCSLTSWVDTNYHEAAAVVKVSCGLGIGDNQGPGKDMRIGQVTVVDAAYSGRVFMAAWTAGLHKDALLAAPANVMKSGTVLGITIFTDLSPKGTGTSYLLETGTELQITDARIVWSGHEFMLFLDTQ